MKSWEGGERVRKGINRGEGKKGSKFTDRRKFSSPIFLKGSEMRGTWSWSCGSYLTPLNYEKKGAEGSTKNKKIYSDKFEKSFLVFKISRTCKLFWMKRIVIL